MIHTYKLNGKNFVLDVNSGGVHLVDDLAYDCIEFLRDSGAKEEPLLNEAARNAAILQLEQKDYKKSEIAEALDEIAALTEAGKLFSGDEEYVKLAAKKSQTTPQEQKNVIKALCLHVAHTCNLDCEYCFARGGTYHGKHTLMSREVGEKAIDFLIEKSGSRRNLEVDFFGGEPLMNWETVKHIVNYARNIEEQHNKNFRFTLTTNGMLVTDEVIDFCNAQMANVVLSLDGRPAVHDRFRVTPGGVGSYDVVVPKFVEFAKRRKKNYYMRGTYTHFNTDFTEDIFHMAELGFDELSMEPVVCPPGSPNALTDDDLPVLFEQYEILALEMLKREKTGSKPFNFYHYNIDLKNGPCIHKRILGCGSGSEYMAVTPTGELYPCHQFVGDKDFALGDVWNGVKNFDIIDKFKKSSLYSKPQCGDCWGKFYCSGGCAANAYHSCGDINGIYEFGCKLFKKRIECGIMLNVEKTLLAEARNEQI
ncbi:MAG: thioether cross-link-forming SCIFF peptide maturase [Oscillospiraceae bacterium]|nr:thioether cross-link-forming SCIFF peptide maturase [Oscillospiraceae bacterium]